MLGCTQHVQGLSLSTLFKLASLRLIHHQGDPLKYQRLLWPDACAQWQYIFKPLSTWAPRAYSECPFVTSNRKNQARYCPSILMGLRGRLCSPSHTQTWDLGFQLVKTAVHSLFVRLHPQISPTISLQLLSSLRAAVATMTHPPLPPHFRRVERKNF